jgi:DNA invertase Pin-like site-specific DNA recombinase
VYQAPATDLLHRVQRRQLLDDAAKGKFSVVLMFKLDRAFRSVKHMHDTLAALGSLLLNLLASLAEFELEIIRERVKAGMERARKQGKKVEERLGRLAQTYNDLLYAL